MLLFTIGFTRKSAEQFFGALMQAQVRVVIDTRLHNTSQLSGFAKQGDLRYFLHSLGDIEYRHEPLLAPEEALLHAYQKKRLTWDEYAASFVALLRSRRIEQQYRRVDFDHGCLLCSEAQPHHCHRRLVAEYLQEQWGDFEIRHLS